MQNKSDEATSRGRTGDRALRDDLGQHKHNRKVVDHVAHDPEDVRVLQIEQRLDERRGGAHRAEQDDAQDLRLPARHGGVGVRAAQAQPLEHAQDHRDDDDHPGDD
jgi:hypothetical protein